MSTEGHVDAPPPGWIRIKDWVRQNGLSWTLVRRFREEGLIHVGRFKVHRGWRLYVEADAPVPAARDLVWSDADVAVLKAAFGEVCSRDR